MSKQVVEIPGPKEPIKKSPGFKKKELSDYKLNLLGLCGFGCRYCSSNVGNYLRINRERFADATKEQLGERVYPVDNPKLTFTWPNVLGNLERQVRSCRPDFGEGQVLVVSMLTDPFSRNWSSETSLSPH